MNQRIVSFLPAATEMIFALGLEDQLVGVSHECDFPPEAKKKPSLIKPALALDKMTPREIDEAVSARVRSGQSLYNVDERLLRDLAPDLIVTQDLCQVCAPSGNEVSEVLKSLPNRPQIVYLTPHCIEGVFENIRELGAVTGCVPQAESLVAQSRSRLENAAARTRQLKERPRVFCCEWIDPLYCSGHWVPEMVELAGGVDALAKKGSDSVRITWEEVLRWAPEVFLLSLCGYTSEKALEQAPQLFSAPGWFDLPAVKSGRIYAVDANAYFARPGPRLIDGVELLAHLVHPEIFDWRGPTNGFYTVRPRDRSA